ncbi:MAG: tryptophan--tRNA ligase [Candidatus Pacebacteria bacterium CG10_big_fil_rev_8_21_14_0_10_56_10]|nr:MAG: tryptophan--tRNA ligase [Candidatus Pacebacteria bacterium CG10_big_fil_rev_8_21_14_0_10_56_10]
MNTSSALSAAPSSAVPHRVLSGIRATGRLHLGNYLGALKGMIELERRPEYQTFYMVADVHTVTTPYDVEELRHNRREIIIDYLAAGLDPEQSTLFIQSMVPEHLELAFYLASVSSVARMQHLPTFKDKVKQHPQHVTLALLNYPVLMAADILIYKATQVPVGIDQQPHLEVAREIARKMNQQYGTDFPEPQRFVTPGEYVPSLKGEGKMSKSVEGSYINLTDTLAEIEEKLKRVPSDSGRGERPPETGGAATLLKLVELFQGQEARQAYEAAYTGEGIRYAQLKSDLAEAVYQQVRPIQQRRAQLEAAPASVDQVIEAGAAKARQVASQTLEEVKYKLGLG